MGIFLLLIALAIVGLCITGSSGRKIILTIVAGILCFPLGVIMALTKRYK